MFKSILLFVLVVSCRQDSQLQESSPETFEGELNVYYVDKFDQPTIEYSLAVNDEKTIPLVFSEDPRLEHGTRVSIVGIPLGGKIQVQGIPQVIQPVQSISTVKRNHVLVAIVEFSNKKIACSEALIKKKLFTDSNSVRNYYLENSRGAVKLTGDILGPFKIDEKNDNCNYGAWAMKTNAKLKAAKVDVSKYGRILYVTPRGTCGAWGIGTYGGNPSRAWNLGVCGVSDLYAHEFGHNFGMGHSARGKNQYGDLSCVMGYSNVGLRGLNAPRKVQMNWLSKANVRTIARSGTYKINSLSASSSGTQVLKVKTPNRRGYYYVSYRTPVGFDRFLRTVFKNRTSVHRFPGGNMTWIEATLGNGQEFATAGTKKIRIKQISKDRRSARVTITLP